MASLQSHNIKKAISKMSKPKKNNNIYQTFNSVTAFKPYLNVKVLEEDNNYQIEDFTIMDTKFGPKFGVIIEDGIVVLGKSYIPDEDLFEQWKADLKSTTRYLVKHAGNKIEIV